MTGTSDQNELRELLLKCWMTHDGAWFYHCLQELGMEATNRLNKAAIRTLAEIELPRITRALGISIEKPVDFKTLELIIDGMFSVVKGDFMDFDYGFPDENIMEWRMHRCFAYEAMKKMGVGDRYQCGLVYRVGIWVETLGVAYEIDPPMNGCMMNREGFCSALFMFKFEKAHAAGVNQWDERRAKDCCG